MREPDYPATVSAFRIDKYEVTVGRFRAFTEAPNSAWVPAEGAGKNPNDRTDTGWQSAWNDYLKASPSDVVSVCYLDPGTWTSDPGENENKPINCVTWFTAFAFCVWDGGRLPTEAEWNYAATRGTSDLYPWGNKLPTVDLANFNCRYPTKESFCSSTDARNLANVGSTPAGNALWPTGEIADLAGNVAEWCRDSHTNDLIVPCVDCAYFSSPIELGAKGVLHGGSFFDADVGALHNESRRDAFTDDRRSYEGVRCVRSP